MFVNYYNLIIMAHKCDNCENIFKTRSAYLNHLEKKNGCEKRTRDYIDKNYLCIFCHNNYKRKDVLVCHKKMCKLNPENA
jgi:hypothetical protein